MQGKDLLIGIIKDVESREGHAAEQESRMRSPANSHPLEQSTIKMLIVEMYDVNTDTSRAVTGHLASPTSILSSQITSRDRRGTG